MRIVYIDMHCLNFVVKPFNAIYNKSKIVTYKHKFLVDYALNNGVEVCNYISGEKTAICGIYKYIYKMYKLFGINTNIIEAKYVLEKSYGKNKINNILTKDEIKNDDIVICYLYDENQLKIVKGLPGIKVCFMNHFVAINKKINFADYGINAIVNECDLSENEFFQKNFMSDGVKIIICPYAYAERFYDKNGDRIDKAFIVGTLSTCNGNKDYKLYRDFFKTEWIQNLRKLFFDNKYSISDIADTYVSYIKEDNKKINNSDPFFVKFYKKLYNRIKPNVQSKYTSFNMVDKFNEYSMFLCPEENADMPGIGYVEGMACGTAYIGLDRFYYKSLGLIPNKNYITYDGTIDGLRKVVNYYREHKEELEKIRRDGFNFVREFNKAENICNKFYVELENIRSEKI